MTEDMKKKTLQTTHRRIMRMIIQTKEKIRKCFAVAHAASVDEITDGALVDDTTEHNNQDPNEHEESSHDADSKPCFDEIA